MIQLQADYQPNLWHISKVECMLTGRRGGAAGEATTDGVRG